MQVDVEPPFLTKQSLEGFDIVTLSPIIIRSEQVVCITRHRLNVKLKNPKPLLLDDCREVWITPAKALRCCFFGNLLHFQPLHVVPGEANSSSNNRHPRVASLLSEPDRKGDFKVGDVFLLPDKGYSRFDASWFVILAAVFSVVSVRLVDDWMGIMMLVHSSVGVANLAHSSVGVASFVHSFICIIRLVHSSVGVAGLVHSFIGVVRLSHSPVGVAGLVHSFISVIRLSHSSVGVASLVHSFISVIRLSHSSVGVANLSGRC